VPPDVAIEILCADDRPTDIGEKVRVYLAAGIGRDEAFEHVSLTGSHMAIAELITPPLPLERQAIARRYTQRLEQCGFADFLPEHVGRFLR
jgi:hypothetical protein